MCKKFNVCGIAVDSYTGTQLAELMAKDCDSRVEPKIVLSLNGESLSKYHSDRSFKILMDKADVIHPDGKSIVIMGNILNRSRPFMERVATTDFFHDAARTAIDKGISFYFLGANAKELENMISKLKVQYPALKIAGYRDGYFSTSEESAIVNDINASGADVLWLGMGRPKQEAFAVNHVHEFTNVSWIKTCGGLFDFLSGKNTRAPFWMQQAGLEWLYRLSLEPRRLFKRYLITNLHSVYLFFRYYFRFK